MIPKAASRSAASWITRSRARTICQVSHCTFRLRHAPPIRLGVKGCGEAGAVALFPAIGNAIADAIGVTRLDGPASPFRVWQAMQQRG